VNSLLFVVDAIDSDMFLIYGITKNFLFSLVVVLSTFFEKLVRLLLMNIFSLSSFIFLNKNGRGLFSNEILILNVLGYFW